MAMTTGEKLLIGSGAAIVGLAIILAVRKASAAPAPPGGLKPLPPEYDDIPIPVREPGIPVSDVGHPLSSAVTTPSTDPLLAGGWHWEYLGAADPSEAPGVIGEQLSPGSLPFKASAVTMITPLQSIELAYYVGPGDILVRGYYLIGPMKSSGYGFEAGAWGIVEVWDPAWHGY